MLHEGHRRVFAGAGDVIEDAEDAEDAEDDGLFARLPS